MKLYGSLTSPFVRTVRIAAAELGLADRLSLEPTVVKPTQPNRTYGAAVNPLRRVPALETDDGRTLVDSAVIIAYLDSAAGGGRVVPLSDDERIDAMNRYGIVAGATEALVSAMYETRLRPEELRWPEWAEDQVDKARSALDWAEARIDDFAAFDIGSIGLVSLLGYAQFRFAGEDWTSARPRLRAFEATAGERASVRATGPRE